MSDTLDRDTSIGTDNLLQLLNVTPVACSRSLRVLLRRCDETINIRRATGSSELFPLLRTPPPRSRAAPVPPRVTTSDPMPTPSIPSTSGCSEVAEEPYVRKGVSHTFYGLGTRMSVVAIRSQRPMTMVAVCNFQFQMLFVSQLGTTHCVCAEISAPGFSFYVVSHYFQYRDEIGVYLRHFENVLKALRGRRLVAVDSNARSPLWGPQRPDKQGEQLEGLIGAFGMQVVNDTKQGPTYRSTRGSSFIDVTLASPSIRQFVRDWKVRSDWTTSDHSAIDIRLNVPKAAARTCISSEARFDTNRANWEGFSESLVSLARTNLEFLSPSSKADVETMARTLSEIIIEACKASMLRKRKFRRSNPWWTRELSVRKKTVAHLRKRLQKQRIPDSRLLQEYRSSLRSYNKLIKKIKRENWRRFVTSHGNEKP
ncbi:uncharacterized protein LOC118644950 [Monomorium pharaonis]|uniref:uncharacterized protein LOC118644950 n=1 Tax=Monomorium pharaonis TaxID=307658 RepID=UPI00174746F2|nr:uncharacterized protein LOC118644950 [Monomorium pharaonis]